MKTKIKSHSDETTDFQNKMPNVGSSHTFLEVITIDSTLKKEENYYPQAFLKECKYIEKKVIRHTTENIEVFFLKTLMNNCLLNRFDTQFLKRPILGV